MSVDCSRSSVLAASAVFRCPCCIVGGLHAALSFPGVSGLGGKGKCMYNVYANVFLELCKGGVWVSDQS